MNEKQSFGHSDVIHYKRPAGAKPTDDVEEFIRQAQEAGTLEVIRCAKEFEGDPEWQNLKNRRGLKGEDYDEAWGPGDLVNRG